MPSLEGGMNRSSNFLIGAAEFPISESTATMDKRRELPFISEAKEVADAITRALIVSKIMTVSRPAGYSQCVQRGKPGGILTVNEVIKAGSLGHGTAVPGHCDIDIVIYSDSKGVLDPLALKSLYGAYTGVDPQETRHNGFFRWFRAVENHLGEKELSWKDYTEHCIQFQYNNKINVDIYVSPYWRVPSELYTFLQSIPRKERSR